jgi:hypothetical protein
VTDDAIRNEPDVFPGEEPDSGASPSLLPVAPPAYAAQIPSRYRQSASASILAAGLLGLRDIIEPPKDARPVIEQHSEDDDVDRAVEVYLDPDDPASSLVVIRDPHDAN